ncbi:hypothetical protein PAPYR_9884 [Paratrimastix pyriformis]|uniref:Uncharacterized protein n=1 Tax=Paratrimastix pyriformis TaxID=342808 RepID=A0ABQ8UA38_9EUKA|nr:hypothetical protein PAPYR_9884 [Paratrimastix pyriformis]
MGSRFLPHRVYVMRFRVPNANSCYGVTLGICGNHPFCGGYNPGGWSNTIFGNGGYLRKTCRNNPYRVGV